MAVKMIFFSGIRMMYLVLMVRLFMILVKMSVVVSMGVGI